MRFACFLTLLMALAVFAGCGGGGETINVTGTIGGTIDVGGPISGMAELTVGAFTAGGTTAVEEVTVGEVTTSAVNGSITGREITFEFTNLALGEYEIAVYSGDTEYYRSAAISLTRSARERLAQSRMTSKSTNVGFGPRSSARLRRQVRQAPQPLSISGPRLQSRRASRSGSAVRAIRVTSSTRSSPSR